MAHITFGFVVAFPHALPEPRFLVRLAQAAEELGLDFLGEIPLDPQVRAGADAGVPIMESDPESPVAKALAVIAQKVAAKSSVQQFFAQSAVNA